MKRIICISAVTLFTSIGLADIQPSVDLQKVNGRYTNCLNAEADLLVKTLACDFSKDLNDDILSVQQTCNLQIYKYLLDQRTSIANVTLAMEQLGTVNTLAIIENKMNSAKKACGVNGSL